MKKENKKPSINTTMLQKEPHTPLVQDRKRACDCPTAFFYSQIPCLNEPHNYTGNSTVTFMFNDAVYNKTNSNIYALDTDGALLIKTGGTYFATLKADVNFWGDATNAAISATIIVETPTGFTPYSTQQMPVMFHPITAEDAHFERAILHANAVIHVGDANYGIGAYGCQQARVYLWLSVDGNIEYTPSLEFTVRN